MKTKICVAKGVCLAALLSTAASGQQAPPKLKVFISVDMEGISGVVHGDHTSSSGLDYARARKWMTEEANAAIDGALAAGATEILVNDSHGNMRNLLLEELRPQAQLITGSPKTLSMMEGIDNTFDAVVFVGYHAAAGTAKGVLDHTYSGRTVSNIWINGRPMNEAILNAAIAGHYGVPVVFIAGDAAVVAQTKEVLGDIEGVAVKEGVARYAAKSLHPETVHKLIREGVQRGVERRKTMRLFKLEQPIRLEIEFVNSGMADMAELIPGVKRIDGRKVSYTGRDYLETFKLMRGLIALASVE